MSIFWLKFLSWRKKTMEKIGMLRELSEMCVQIWTRNVLKIYNWMNTCEKESELMWWKEHTQQEITTSHRLFRKLDHHFNAYNHRRLVYLHNTQLISLSSHQLKCSTHFISFHFFFLFWMCSISKLLVNQSTFNHRLLC